MTVDKRINYFKGGGYQEGTNTSDRRTGGQGTQVSRNERPSRKTVPSGNTGSNDRQSYNVNKSTVDVGGGKARKLNARDYALLTRNNYNRSGFGGANRIGGAGRFDDMYTGGGLKDLFKGLLSFKVPGASFLFNKGKQGIAGMNNVLNDFTRNMRKGFDTQEEYEIDRQNKIDDNTIRTLENTIQKKYLDKNRSLDETQLDEKLAALKQSLGMQETAQNVLTGKNLNLREGLDSIPTETLDFIFNPTKSNRLNKSINIKTPNNMGKDFSDVSSLLNGSGILGINQDTDNMRLAQTFNTANDLMGMVGATEPGKFFGTNLSDQGEALEEFREAAVNFKNAPKNTANTAQSAFDFIMNTNPNMYKDIKKNKNFIQDAINQGFLGSESDYINQNPLTKIDLAEGGITSLLKI